MDSLHQIRRSGRPARQRINDVSAAQFPRSLEGSLRRLQTDHIDIYLYHTTPVPGEAEKVARLLEQAKQQGKIRATGISTNDFKHVQYLHSLGCLDVVEFALNMTWPQPQITDFIARHQLGGIIRGVLAAGKLSGKYFHQPPILRPDDVRSNWYDPHAIAADFARYAVFEELCTPTRDMVQLALRWVLDLPTTHTIILGAKTFAEYANAAKATDIPPLTSTECARITQLSVPLSARR